MIRKLWLIGVAAGVAATTVVALASAASHAKQVTLPSIPAFKANVQDAPSANDWVVPEGSVRADRYSTLTQINPGNAGSLKLAFAHDLEVADGFGRTHLLDGTGDEQRGQYGQEARVSEYQGVLYAEDAGGRISALDATNGNLLWHFEPNSSNHPFESLTDTCAKPCTTPFFPGGNIPGTHPLLIAAERGVAIGGGMVFAAEIGGIMVGLDAKTGKQIWAHTVFNPIFGGALSSAPIYYQGKVLMATAGGDSGFACIAFALDAKTGKPLWHFNFIPQKGEPGYNTWNQPIFWNGGGAVWGSGAIDVKNNLIYYSVGNPIPLTGYQRGPGKEYYTNGTIALHIDTGKYAWFHQQVHHDNWDIDTTLGPMLYQGTINGKPNQSGVVATNKNGLVFVYDSKTGAPLFPFSEQPVPVYAPVSSYPTQPIPVTEPIFPKVLDDPNWTAFKGLQGPDGKPFIYQNTVAGNTFAQADTSGYAIRIASTLRPSAPAAIDRKLGYAFFAAPVSVSATEELPPSEIAPSTAIAGGPVNGGVHSKSATITGIPAVDALNGFWLGAMDLNTGKMVWRDAHLTANTAKLPAATNGNFDGGITATASGVLFSGNGNAVSAFDSKTGALLWTSNQLVAIPFGSPTTYSVNGKQYVAVVAGSGSSAPQTAGEKTTVSVYSLP